MIAWSDSHPLDTGRSGRGAAAADALAASVRTGRARRVDHHDDAERRRPDAPVAVSIGDGTLYVDAYTARLSARASQQLRAFMSELRAWHRWIGVAGDGRPWPAPSPAGPTSVFAVHRRLPASICGCRATGRGTRSGPCCCSTAARAARPATSTGTTSSASGPPCRSSSSWSSAVPISFPWANARLSAGGRGCRRPDGRRRRECGRGGEGARAAGARRGRNEGGAATGGAGEGGAVRRRRNGDRAKAIAAKAARRSVAERRCGPGRRQHAAGARAASGARLAHASTCASRLGARAGGLRHRPRRRRPAAPTSTLTLARGKREVVSYEDFAALTLAAAFAMSCASRTPAKCSVFPVRRSPAWSRWRRGPGLDRHRAGVAAIPRLAGAPDELARERPT